ncbi:hypothetical protein [Liquorilactobacillus mali]|nr:hypothetical protein [Liquorilactobacillus mali]MDC7952068.1 hypothetical protein [Liquorilactobacillus mali]
MTTFIAIIGILIFATLVQFFGNVQQKRNEYKHFKNDEVQRNPKGFEN